MKNFLICVAVGIISLGMCQQSQAQNNLTLRLREPNKTTDYNPRTMPVAYKRAISAGDGWWDRMLNTGKSRTFITVLRSGDLSSAFPGFENGLFSGGRIFIWHKSSNVGLTAAHEAGHGFLGGHVSNTVIDGSGRSRWRLNASQVDRMNTMGYINRANQTRWKRRFSQNRAVPPGRNANVNGRDHAGDPSKL